MDAGVSLEDLINEGLLSDLPPMMLTSYDLPGTVADTEALGYLHANCGHCHNDSATGLGFPSMALWSVTSAEQLMDAPVFLTAVGVSLQGFGWTGGNVRIEPGDHAASAVWYRMSQRGNNEQMPPIGTEVVDQTGLDTIAMWIDSL